MRFSSPLTALMALLSFPARALGPAPLDTHGLMSPPQFQSIPSRKADVRIPYGLDAEQFGDLRLPRGKGLHPLVILVHGGCWKSAYSTLSDLAPMADALTGQGVATWNIEYRRLGQKGGGWPGTYLDVGKALDHVKTFARAKHLDLSRVVVVGHSAGGHLAMWAASRHRLPSSSALYRRNPLRFRAVFDLAGGPDMAAYIPVEQQACADNVVEQMMGGGPKERPIRYRESSASRMLPLGVKQTIVWGSRDSVVPEAMGIAYAAKARRSGDHVEMVSFPAAGHFEIASPLDQTWPTIRSKIIRALGQAAAEH